MRFSFDKFFVVACFCFVACFPWSLGFDIKLYSNVLIVVFAFIWWLCISLIATLLQWRMPSCCHTLFMSLKSYWLLCWQWSNTSTSPCNEVVLALVFWHESAPHLSLQLVITINLHQHLPLPRRRINTRLCNEAISTFIFPLMMHQYLSLSRRCINTYPWHEAASTLAFALKLCQHPSFPWSHNSCLCTNTIFCDRCKNSTKRDVVQISKIEDA